jgi:hypothetical protein
LSLIVVLIGLPRITPCRPMLRISRSASGDILALAAQLPPDLAHAVDVAVLPLQGLELGGNALNEESSNCLFRRRSPAFPPLLDE